MKTFTNSVKYRNPQTNDFETLPGLVGPGGGVHVGAKEPTNTNVNVWVTTEKENYYEIPEINDKIVSSEDTWSSEKISEELKHTHENFDNDIIFNGLATLAGGLGGIRLGNGMTFNEGSRTGVSLATTYNATMVEIEADSPGIYIAFGCVTFAQHGSHIRVVNLNVGNAVFSHDTYAPQDYQTCRLSVSGVNKLAKGETITLYAQQNSGTTLTANGYLYVLKIPIIE